MCRINGILILNKTSQHADLSSIGDSLRDKLAHGGPDDFGSFIDEASNIYLGHRRLSILDVSEAGQQPMVFNQWVIVYNGEVYNFQLIKKELIDLGYAFQTETDTEVILKAYHQWGNDAVNRFRGMFAFALWNKETQTLILCRDRIGVKPLYYYIDENVFLFASELKGITAYPGLNLEIDQNSVSNYLQVGYIKSPNSIYKHVKKLKPGSFLYIKPNKSISEQPYWSLNAIKVVDNGFTDDYVLKKANDLLIESVTLRMVSDVPVGVFLSGGIDSSLVSAILSKDLGYKINTFSIGFSEKDFDESKHAKKVANYLGTTHSELVLGASHFLDALDEFYNVYDEPFGDGSGIPTYLLSKFSKEQVTVALSADGGDEVFGGYDRYIISETLFDRIKPIPKPLRVFASQSIMKANSNLIRKLYTYFTGTHDTADLDWRLPKLLNVLGAENLLDCYTKSHSFLTDYSLTQLHQFQIQKPFFEEESFFETKHTISSFGKIDVNSYLEGDILTKVDRATMHVALEGREPLLDHTLIEFGLSLPNQFKYRNGKGKWILRTLLEEKIPKELIDRPKKGFAPPLNSWLNNHLKPIVVEMSNNQEFHRCFLFNTILFKKLINDYFSQKSFVNPHFIWNLHMLYVWYKKNLNHA